MVSSAKKLDLQPSARKAYPTDLTDSQWELIRPLLPSVQKRGRRPQNMREIVNSMLYIFKSGHNWRMMPHDLPPWQTVYGYYRKWLKEGIWEKMDEHLRLQIINRSLERQSPALVINWISNRLKQVKETKR